MLDLSKFHYAPILKWKFGEISACGSLLDQIADAVLPVFDVPPGDEWDYDHLKRVTLSEHLRHFGARLAKHRRGNPALIDANTLEKEGVSLGWDEHPLTGLLERARQSKAIAGPVVTLDSSEEYLNAAAAFLAKHSHVIWALRLGLSKLEKPGWHNEVASLQDRGLVPPRGVLLIDAGPISSWDEGLVDIIVDRINHIPSLLHWGNLFFCSTSFPEKRKGAPGTIGRYRRSDKELFDALASRRGDLLRIPRFGDYGVEFPSKFVKGIRGAKAHLRYSSATEYIVAEGPSVKGNGYRAIVPVAGALKNLDEFEGASFSAGDFYIARMISEGTPGNPSRWRACATDHHMTRVLKERFPGKFKDQSTQPQAIELQSSFLDFWSQGR